MIGTLLQRADDHSWDVAMQRKEVKKALKDSQ